MHESIHIIGGGLAGSEAAWQIAEAGLPAVLHEMRPVRPTAAHQTDRLAELVCSNSLKSEQENSAPWLLKQELRRLGSLVLRAAAQARVPGGHALTVDRDVFSAEVTRAIGSHPRIEDPPGGSMRNSGSGRRRHHHHRHRPAHQRCPGRGNRTRHRIRAALLLRQHQPDRRGRLGRSDHRLPRLAL